ncbi:mercuric transport protein MerTP [Zeaxanthinibacter enoshimensis]|uniref:Mercuric transport protein MerT n=1 Tax=Zeaxanthinibacter enoshimensis TaxID=392009 RepID=A0A4V6PWB8_9FLAO|nr:mercuric transport protein MerTP [Zeaxanthinibacter enoshimensis]TDQ32201.1 copper chaperone CopZ [Zeaxanthinibacter enoshimensis]
MKSGNKLGGLGLLTAISASLCCITPVLALLAGTSGLASTFSWLDPLQPYFIGLTILILGLAWYKALRPVRQTDCLCETEDKKPFLQTGKFLGILTLFTALLLTFPLYAHIFYHQNNQQILLDDQAKLQKAEFKISGMTCTGCEAPIDHEINKVPGIFRTTVSYEYGNAMVEFDPAKTSVEEIESAITKTGYTVTGTKKAE